ncbi:MAG TPA: lauroyl acyltransferase [Alphaproteobacteria bacterium]|jgi:KDO2-lipid IV(A) lauroyltransferase|nr:lauroyl acyltransferase [Alphaproteobacteria bacterium]
MAERRPLRDIGYFIQAVLLTLFLGLCRLLPVDGASALGGWIGRAIGPRMGQSRKALRNLARALPENSPAENRRIVTGMWDNLGRTIAEYPHLPRICATLEGGRLDIRGLDHLTALMGDGKPGIMWGGHLANWEVAPFCARHTGLDLAFIYRAPNNQWVDRLIRRLRDTPQMFRKGQEGAKALVGVLRHGGHAAMLVDQKMNDGIPVPFFGRDAMTAPAIAQFGIRFGCVLLPMRTERLDGARFRITVFPPMEMPDTGDRPADERSIMVAINQLLEGWIRERPEQWLWLHRRWPD